MLYSTNLLNSRVSLPSDYSELKSRLIAKLFEIEHGETQRRFPDLLVIGKVTDVIKHPNADTLFVCQVDCWPHGKFQICTWGENVASGQYVPTALPGCYLPAIQMEIGSRKMRGEESNGMICSKWELWFKEDEDQHWIWDMTGDLPCDDSMVGKSFKECFPMLENTIFEVESVAITNRPDLWGHVWLAAECASIFTDTLQKTDKIVKFMEDASEFKLSDIESMPVFNKANTINTIIQTQKCCYYSLSYFPNVLNDTSVFIGRASLMDLGHTPRRNWIDFSNHFMSNYGQPIHVFDASKISWNITIKEATWGEAFTDLTWKEHSLEAWDIIICDEINILALAGIIGWENCAFGDNTSAIYIEVAHFDPIQIRKTSTRLGLKTEAAIRYEKWINPLWTTFCVQALYQDLTENDKQYHTWALARITHDTHNLTTVKPSLTIDIAKTVHYLQWGENGTIANQIPPILQNLGYTNPETNGALSITNYSLSITPPIWRSDVQIIQDIYEDLARHIGLENIPEVATPVYVTRTSPTITQFCYEIAEKLIHTHAFSQAENYPWYNEEWISLLNLDHTTHLDLLNPTDSQTPFMAQTLLPWLLNLAKNNYRITLPIKVFEIGKTFKLTSKKEETKVLALLALHKKSKDWQSDTYIEVRKALNTIQNQFWLPANNFQLSTHHYLHPTKQADIIIDSEVIWSIWQIHPSLLQWLWFDDEIEVSYCELALLPLMLKQGTQATDHYQSNADQIIVRDLSFQIPSSQTFDKIINSIEDDEQVQSLEVIDLYQPQDQDNKSIAIRINIRSTGNLSSAEIGEVMNTIIWKVELTGATLKWVKNNA